MSRNINEKDYNDNIKEYKFGLGELFLGNTSNKIERSSIAVFDTVSHNYHFYPKNKDDLEKLETNLNNKRNSIIGKIKRRDNLQLVETWEDMNVGNEKASKDDTIFYANRDGTLKQDNDHLCHLFKYIAAVKNNVLYELNFMRFYISTDKKINCILKSIQFDRVIDSPQKIEKRYANRNEIYYPTAYTNRSIDKLQNIVGDNKGKSIFFNPQVDYEDEPEIILNAFIDFINTCDKYGSKTNA